MAFKVCKTVSQWWKWQKNLSLRLRRWDMFNANYGRLEKTKSFKTSFSRDFHIEIFIGSKRFWHSNTIRFVYYTSWLKTDVIFYCLFWIGILSNYNFNIIQFIVFVSHNACICGTLLTKMLSMNDINYAWWC